MVKTRAPMLSLSAQGTIAGALTFSSWKGRSYARQRVDPTQPRTGPQVGRRSMFAFLTQTWDSLSTADQATWQTLADQLVTAPFHAFLSGNMEGWHNFLAPSSADPPTRNDTPATFDGPQGAAWQENRIQFTSKLAVPNQNKGIIIFASLDTGFDSAVANAMLVETQTDADIHNYYWTPPSIATWYFTVRSFSVKGVLSAAEAEFSAVP